MLSKWDVRFAEEPILTRSVLKTKKLRALRRLNMASSDVPYLSAPVVVKPEIKGDVDFKIKSQFMQELREDTFSGNKNDDAHEHAKRVLDIVNIFYNGLSTMNRQLLDSQRPIPGMTPAQALTAIQTMADHSQKWHDGSSSRSINNNSNTEGITSTICRGAHLDKECPQNEEVKSVEEVKYGEFRRPLPFSASINVIPKSMFEHLKLARLKKTDMLVEMDDMTKRASIGIVENILIKIDKFLFPSDFMVIDMIKTRNKIVILKRPFLATIHAEIDVFNKEISLGIGDDRVTFDMNMKVNNFTTPVGLIYMINDEPSSSNDTPTDESSRVEKSNDLIQNHDSKKTRTLETNTHIPSVHFCKPIKQICNRTLRFWPICNPTMKARNGGRELVKDPRSRSFNDYKWMLELEIDQLADEYELGIGKKGHMLDEIWENYKKVQGDNTYWWYDQESKEKERREMGTDI
nr:hypothetical protein [Tanacetum cinerariifolium]